MKFDLLTVVGFLTVLSSYAIKFIGFPDQIRKIKKTKSVNGISIYLFIFSFISYILWTLYGLLKNDWVVIAGQSVGIIVSGVVLFQILKYKKGEEE